jgi:hypothetical protein
MKRLWRWLTRKRFVVITIRSEKPREIKDYADCLGSQPEYRKDMDALMVEMDRVQAYNRSHPKPTVVDPKELL